MTGKKMTCAHHLRAPRALLAAALLALVQLAAPVRALDVYNGIPGAAYGDIPIGWDALFKRCVGAAFRIPIGNGDRVVTYVSAIARKIAGQSLSYSFRLHYEGPGQTIGPPVPDASRPNGIMSSASTSYTEIGYGSPTGWDLRLANATEGVGTPDGPGYWVVVVPTSLAYTQASDGKLYIRSTQPGIASSKLVAILGTFQQPACQSLAWSDWVVDSSATDKALAVGLVGYDPNAPTPTSTASASAASASVSASPSPTSTPSPTPSPTPSVTPTASLTSTVSESPTASPTPSVTPSPSLSSSPTPSPSVSRSPNSLDSAGKGAGTGVAGLSSGSAAGVTIGVLLGVAGAAVAAAAFARRGGRRGLDPKMLARRAWAKVRGGSAARRSNTVFGSAGSGAGAGTPSTNDPMPLQLYPLQLHPSHGQRGT